MKTLSTNPRSIARKTGVTVYSQVADIIADQIKSNGWKAGDVIPPYRELVTLIGASDGTVRRALGILEERGEIERGQGRGTFVKDRLAVGEVAVLAWSDMMRPNNFPCYGMVASALVKALAIRNPAWRVKMHMGQEPVGGVASIGTFDLLEPDVLKRLRAVFSFPNARQLENLMPGLKAAKVPVVILTESDTEYSVCIDRRSLYSLALAELRASGCRRFGVIYLGRSPSDLVRAMPEFPDLETRPEWLIGLDAYPTASALEQAAYSSFMKFWEQPERPDGLVVADDICCGGILRAISHLGIRLPDMLRLVSHANHGHDLPYHQPVTRVEFDPEEIADRAAEMMTALLHGRNPNVRHVCLPGKLVKGGTT
ncbi:MAG: substrate-binding domain-containing protein [Kiritimatiellae bacterium]|nr:substrate-binding domain-containing protein [Kiritimatiellia bacterium]